jgi:hypothetical protein
LISTNRGLALFNGGQILLDGIELVLKIGFFIGECGTNEQKSKDAVG